MNVSQYAAPLALLAVPIAAQELDLKQLLPADSVLYVSIPDIPETLDGMQGMPLLKMWNEGEVQDFLAGGLKLLHSQFDNWMAQGQAMYDAGALPINPSELTNLRADGFGFGVARLGIDMDGQEPQPMISAFAHFDFGTSGAQWRELINTMLAMGPSLLAPMGQDPMAEDGPLKRVDSQIGEASLTTFSSNMGGPPLSLNLAWVGDHLIIGTHEEDTKALLGRIGNPAGSLGESAHFAASAKQLDGDGAEAEVFMQPGAVIDTLMAFMRVGESMGQLPPGLTVDGLERAVTALGLRSVHSMGMSSTYAGDHCVTKSFVSSPVAERTGLAACMGNQEIALDFLRWIPAEAVGFYSFSFDASAIYDGLTDALNAYDENMAKGMLAQLDQMEQQLGINLKNDLFGAVGNRFVSWSMPSTGFAQSPEQGYIIEMKQPEQFLKALEVAVGFSQGQLELAEVKRRGLEAHQLRLNFDLGNAGMPINPLASIAPTFVFRDQYLILALSTSDLRRAIKRFEREDDPSGDIRSSEAFAPMMEKIPSQGLSSISFADWKASLGGMYQMAASALIFVPIDENIPIDLALLPDASSLTQHLSGSLSWSTTGEDGFHTTIVSPWGPETAALAGVGIMGGITAATIFMGDRFR